MICDICNREVEGIYKLELETTHRMNEGFFDECMKSCPECIGKAVMQFGEISIEGGTSTPQMVLQYVKDEDVKL